MAVNEIKKNCNAKFHKTQNSSPSFFNSFLGQMALVVCLDGSGH
jgi:hypothetical protein